MSENTSWADLTPANAPYLRSVLTPQGAHAEQFYNPPGSHPSEPNYIWLEAGGNLGITDNADPAINHRDTRDHLVSYLNAAGISWRAYVEDIPGDSCPLTAVNQYAPRHNPFVYFDDVTNNLDPHSAYCISHIRPYSELASDLRNNTVARYNFIVPNLCNGMHDCGITAGDTWLSREVPQILASQAYAQGGALFITWDEGSNDSDGPIGMIVLSPYAKRNYSNTIRYTHSSTVRTMQEIFGVGPYLRDAANATTLRDLFVSDPDPAIQIFENGMTNNAGYSMAGPAVAPGSLVALFGRNLTDSRSCLPPACGPSFGPDRRLGSVMTGAQVLVNGRPVPLLYSTPGQLGFQLPAEVSGTQATVQVIVGERRSSFRMLPVAPHAPGIFSQAANGAGPGAVTHANGQLVTVQNPALPGEVLVLYATGLGAVSPAVETGMLPATTSTAVTPVFVLAGGITVIPEFAGHAACCVGLNQVNFRLPVGIASGAEIPVKLTVEGVSSNTVTIAVR